MQEVIQCLEKEVSKLLAIEELAFVQPAIKNMQAPFQCDEKEWMKLTKKMDRKPLSIGKIIENKRLFAVFVGSFRQGPLLLIGKRNILFHLRQNKQIGYRLLSIIPASRLKIWPK